VQLERAAIPDPHRARPILAGRNLALELQVLQRMVLGVHGEAVLGRVRRNSVGDRPGCQDTVVLEPEIPVQAGGVVLLDDVPRRFLRPHRDAPGRLGGGLKVALGAVATEFVRALGRHRR
jgi:hypothetical protein